MTYIIAAIVIILLGFFLYPKKIGQFDLNDYEKGSEVTSENASCFGYSYLKLDSTAMTQTKYCIGIPYHPKTETKIIGQEEPKTGSSVSSSDSPEWEAPWFITNFKEVESEGTLIITEQTENSFHYALDTRRDAFEGRMSGKAYYTGNVAKGTEKDFDEPWGTCEITFTMKGDIIEVTTTDQDCVDSRGVGGFFAGEYRRGVYRE